jgi:hypothetical protein
MSNRNMVELSHVADATTLRELFRVLGLQCENVCALVA